MIEIHWGGKTFQFQSEAEALKAGFHIKDPASSTSNVVDKPEAHSQPTGKEKHAPST